MSALNHKKLGGASGKCGNLKIILVIININIYYLNKLLDKAISCTDALAAKVVNALRLWVEYMWNAQIATALAMLSNK